MISRMSINVLKNQLAMATTIVSAAAQNSDRHKVERHITDEMADAGATSRYHWLLSTSASGGDVGENQGYTVSLAQLTVGIVTNALIYVSTTRKLYTASLSEGALLDKQVVVLRFRTNARLREIGWSVPHHEQPVAVEKSLTALGYRLRPTQSDTLALLDVFEGRSAGFVGHAVDVATRLAASLLMSEAHGQVGDWSGRYPGTRQRSIATGSSPVHYRRIARLLANSTRPQEAE